MEITKQYLTNIHTLLDTLMETQSDAIDRAVAAVADTLAQDGMVYAFGTGHSHMLAEELFYRAGGLVKVYPILDEPLMLHSNASRSSQLERLPGYAATLLENGISPTEKDVVFIFSNSGSKSNGIYSIHSRCISTYVFYNTVNKCIHGNFRKLISFCFSFSQIAEITCKS